MKRHTLVLGIMCATASAQVLAQHKPASGTGVTLAPVEVSVNKAASPAAKAHKAQQAVRQTPGGTTFISGERLKERGADSLADLLRYTPGVWAVSHSGNESIFISSRGSNLDAVDYDRNGVKMLLNGLPVTSADGTNHNRLVDPRNADFAVFARGANAMKYGASTLGGAINFVSPTAYTAPQAQLSLGAGSFGAFEQRFTASRVFNPQFDGLVTVTNKRREGFRNHSAMSQEGVYANAGWHINEDWRTRLFFTHVETDQELNSGISRQTLRQDPDNGGADAMQGNYQHDVTSWRLASKTHWQIDKDSELTFGFSYEEQQLFHPIVTDPVPGYQPFFNGLLIDTERRSMGSVVRYTQRLGDHHLTVGANFQTGGEKGEHYGNRHGQRNGLSKTIDQSAYTLETFAMDHWDLNAKWTLVSGLQFVQAMRAHNDVNAFNGARDDLSETYDAINPRLGVIYRVQPGAELYANVSRTYEPPTNFVLKNELANDGTALDAMSGTVAEIGTRGRQSLSTQSQWGWGFSVYYTWLHNEILSVKNPAPSDGRGDTLNAGIDRSVHAGIEAQVHADIALDDAGKQRIKPVLSVTVNHFRFDSGAFDGNTLPAAPDFVVRGELMYHRDSGFYIGPTFSLVGERYADFANTYSVDSYGLLGLLAGWSNDRISVYLQGNNLLDEDYVATHSVKVNAPANAAILSPGLPMRVEGGVKIRF